MGELISRIGDWMNAHKQVALIGMYVSAVGLLIFSAFWHGLTVGERLERERHHDSTEVFR